MASDPQVRAGCGRALAYGARICFLTTATLPCTVLVVPVSSASIDYGDEPWHGTTQAAYQRCKAHYSVACVPCRKVNTADKNRRRSAIRNRPERPVSTPVVVRHAIVHGVSDASERFRIDSATVGEMVMTYRADVVRQRKARVA
jgi:hypothetical protein